jgi:uncharacterized protein (DUF1800 family)
MKTLIAAALLTLAGPALAASSDLALVNRLSWGETAQADTLGWQSARAWLQAQLHPSDDDGLPPDIQAQIDSMEISHTSMLDLTREVRALQKTANALKGTPDFDAANKAYQQKLNDLSRQAQVRSLLRDIYSKNQLKEQLTWFWMNHFNVFAGKGEIRAELADYEDTIRAHALGKFGDLLAATVMHPAMLQYLDNAQNAAGHINENYAREIMELHTLGVGSGYTQQDVQELARILSGLGVNLTGEPPRGQPKKGDYRGKDLTLFNPDRHDFGDKTFLGTTIEGEGLDEMQKAITILVLQPPTAHFVSRQLAQYFCCDAPPERLVNAMAATWKQSGGDIAQVLNTLFASRDFQASLGTKFKDPIHWTVSALRATAGSNAILNAQPILNWLNRMGEPLYGHETPDGYPLTEAAWAGPGEMATRFEIARQIGVGPPQLYQPQPDPTQPPPAPPPRMPPPALQQSAYYQSVSLSPATAGAITQGATPADQNMLYLSSPEFMRR